MLALPMSSEPTSAHASTTHPHPTNAKPLLTCDGLTRELALGGKERRKKRTTKADGVIEDVDKGVRTGQGGGRTGTTPTRTRSNISQDSHEQECTKIEKIDDGKVARPKKGTLVNVLLRFFC